jgi:uncharacterized membrane protein
VPAREGIDVVLAEGFFSRTALGNFGFRWLHVIAGIAWVGLLYYFNFVQVPAFASFGDEARARNIAIDKVARTALWWFRWASVLTVVAGILITLVTPNYFTDDFGSSPGGLSISLGMTIAIVMFLNVWGVIWRCQKVVLANAANVLAGGEVNPAAAAAGRKALMVSRQNTMFSVPMVFFMVYKSHGPFVGEVSSSGVGLFWGVSILLIAILELNSLGLLPWKAHVNKGLNVLYDGPGVRNVIVASFALWAVFLALTEIVFRMNP